MEIDTETRADLQWFSTMADKWNGRDAAYNTYDVVNVCFTYSLCHLKV